MGIGGGPEAGDAGRAPSPPPHVACCDGRKEEAVATEKKREKLKKHLQREARKVEAQASKNGLDEGVHAADGATRSASSDLPSGARPVELREEKRRDHQNPRHRGDLGLRTRVTCEFGGAEGREREKKAEGDDEGTSKRQPEFPSDASTGAPWLFPIRRDWDYRFPEDVPELLQVVCSRINCRPLATDDQDNTRPSSALCSEDGEGMTARNGVAPSHETLEGERLLAVSERMVAEWKQRRAWRQREEKKKKHLAAVPLPPGAPHVTRAAAEEGDTKRSRGDEEVGERASLCALLAACRACPLSWAADGQKPGSKLRGAPAAVYVHHSRRRQPPLPPTEKRGPWLFEALLKEVMTQVPDGGEQKTSSAGLSRRGFPDRKETFDPVPRRASTPMKPGSQDCGLSAGAVCSVRGTGESKQIVSSLVEGPPALPSSPSATASGYERGAGLPAPWALTPESSSQTSFACRPPLLPPAPPSAVPGAPQPPAFLLNTHETWSACPQPPPPRHPQVGGSVCTPPQVEGTGAAAGGGGAPSGELTAAQGRGMMLAPLPPSARHAKAPAQRKHAQADVAVGGGLSGASKGGVRRREDEENRGSGGGRQDVEEGSRLGKREGGKKEGGARLAARYAAGAHPPGSGAGGRGGTGGATAVGDQGASGESVSWPEEVTKQAVRCAIGGTMHEFVRLPDGFSVCFANGNYGAGRFNGFIHLSLPSTGSSSSCPVVPGGYLLLEHAPSWQHPTPMPLFFLRATPRNSRELAEALASPFWARRHPARHLVYRHRAHMLRLLQDRPRKRGKNAQSGGQDQGGKHAATRGGLGEGGGGADGEVKQVPFRAVAEEANSAATANGPNVALGAEQKKSHRRRAEAAASRQAEVAEEEQRVAEGATSRKNRGEGPLAAKARESRKDGRDERGGRTDGEASAQSGEGERTKELDEQPKHTGSASAGCEAKEGGSPPQQGVASPAVSPVAEGNGGALPAPAARLQSFLPADRVGKKRAADRGGKRRQDAPAKCEKTPLPAEGKPRGSLREPQRGGEASRQGRPGCVEEVARAEVARATEASPLGALACFPAADSTSGEKSLHTHGAVKSHFENMTQNFFESSVTSFFQSAPLGSSFSPGSSSSTCPSSSPVATTLLGRGGFTAQMEKAFPYFFSASPQASPAARRSADEARGGGEEGKKSCGSRETHDCPGEALRHAREAGSGCGREAAALLRDAKSALDKVCRQSGQWSVLREAGCPRGDDEGRQFEKHFTCSSLASPLTTFEGERELPPARAAAAAGLTFSSPSPAQFFSAESPFAWAPSLPPSAPQAAPFASASPGLGGVNAPGRLARPPLASALSAVAALSQDLDAAEQRETAAASGLFSKRPFQAEREGSSVGCEAFPSLYSAAERESPAPPQGQPPARRPAFPSLVVGASLCARAGDARAAAGRETSTAFIPDARLLHGGDLCAFPAAASQDIPRGGARGGDAGGPREERNGVFRGARGVSARFLPPARPLGGGGDDPRHAFFVDQMCEGEGELRFTHFFAGEPPADAPREGSLPLAALSASSGFSHAQGSPPRAFASFLSLSGHAADRLNL